MESWRRVKKLFQLTDIEISDYLISSLKNSLNEQNFTSLKDCRKHQEQFFAESLKVQGRWNYDLYEKWQNVVEQNSEYVVQ